MINQTERIAWASPASRHEPDQLRGGVTPHPQGRAKTDPCDVESPMTSTASFVGIDIAKTDFVVACRLDGTSWTAPNDAPGITATIDRERALAPSLIVLEATGRYETPLVAALAAAGLPVVVANPRQVRDFAKATGQFAKTDRLAAHLMALFAERVQPALRPLPDIERQHLTALVTRRRQLLGMLAAECKRLEHAATPIRQEITQTYALTRAPGCGRRSRSRRCYSTEPSLARQRTFAPHRAGRGPCRKLHRPRRLARTRAAEL